MISANYFHTMNSTPSPNSPLQKFQKTNQFLYKEDKKQSPGRGHEAESGSLKKLETDDKKQKQKHRFKRNCIVDKRMNIYIKTKMIE